MATAPHHPEPLQAVQIAIMAKAPIPGLAKTRLIPALGASGAARLHRRLTRLTLACALDARLGAVTIWCAPDRRLRFFRALRHTSGVTLRVQSGGDLGERMHAAFGGMAGPPGNRLGRRAAGPAGRARPVMPGVWRSTRLRRLPDRHRRSSTGVAARWRTGHGRRRVRQGRPDAPKPVAPADSCRRGCRGLRAGAPEVGRLRRASGTDAGPQPARHVRRPRPEGMEPAAARPVPHRHR